MQPWDVLLQEQMLDVAPWFRVIKEKVRAGDLVVSDFYRVEGPDFTTVLALTPENNVLLLQGYLHGVRDVAYAFPGGLVESGETPLTTIQRELREEGGCSAREWQHLASQTLDGNRGYYTGHFFMARGVYRSHEPTTHDLETRTIEHVTLEHLRAMWLKGEFSTIPAVTLIGLAFAHLA